MSRNDSISEIARALIEDPEYVKALTAQIESRTADPELVQRLIAYARARQATLGQAMARKLLTDAGVSWEALWSAMSVRSMTAGESELDR